MHVWRSSEILNEETISIKITVKSVYNFRYLIPRVSSFDHEEYEYFWGAFFSYFIMF